MWVNTEEGQAALWEAEEGGNDDDRPQLEDQVADAGAGAGGAVMPPLPGLKCNLAERTHSIAVCARFRPVGAADELAEDQEVRARGGVPRGGRLGVVQNW